MTFLHRTVKTAALVLSSGLLVLKVASWAGVAVDEVVKTDLLVDLAHALGISLSGTDGAENDVHLLQSETLGFWNEEPDEEGPEEGEKTEEDVGAVWHGSKHVWGDLTDDEVVHPVG